MKLEVGKFYKTWAGNKARIYAVDCGGQFSIHGAVFLNDIWSSKTWCKERVLVDLVSEWTENEQPKKNRLVAYIREKDGCVVFGSESGIFYYQGDMPKLKRAPWLDEPEEK